MRFCSFVLACLLCVPGSAFTADDPLSVAKDLYAAAAYEDALTTLTKISETGGLAPAISLQVDQYRAFCLIALGRMNDAESVTQGILKRDPLFELAPDESSPRVEALFTQVRRRMLPGLIRDKYREAKAAVDRKELADAQTLFGDVQRMIGKAEKFGLKDEAM